MNEEFARLRALARVDGQRRVQAAGFEPAYSLPGAPLMWRRATTVCTLSEAIAILESEETIAILEAEG